MMPVRPLGQSGLLVSAIGFGAWGIGGQTPGATSYGPTDDAASLAAIDAALEAGLTFFDTADIYGQGHSEQLLGQALRAKRERAVIATKGGLARYDRPPDFSPNHLRASLMGSLQRLGSDYVDLWQLHNPPPALADRPEPILELVTELKRAGQIRAFGVSLRDLADGPAMVQALQPDAVQGNLNLLDQRAVDDGLLTWLAQTGVGFIARTPLAFGYLSGTIPPGRRFPPEDHRSRWDPGQLDLWANGAAQLLACRQEGTPVQFAMRFILSLPGVSTVIPGILHAGEVKDYAQRLPPLSQVEMDCVRRVYAENNGFFLSRQAQRLGKI